MGNGGSEDGEQVQCLGLECVYLRVFVCSRLGAGLTRFPKTSSQVIRSPSASSGYFPSTPNSGDSVAFTGISEDLTDSSIPPENIQAGS